MEKYLNSPKSQNLRESVLIEEPKRRIRRNSGVSCVYMYLHADFEDIEFYVARRYVNLTEEEI